MQRQQRNPVNNLRRPVSTVKLCQSEALQVEDEDAREAEDGALAGARGEGTMLACALKDLVLCLRWSCLLRPIARPLMCPAYTTPFVSRIFNSTVQGSSHVAAGSGCWHSSCPFWEKVTW
eukprot:TRINITY_DN5467_c0_g1_i2.p1 TRINITY_DN5467_c0_g1~~TRINITY_DN5467_c0_g1_i2.p1  ORF type:complete len:120 (+),score=10.04 TRINITY_DN5467_c0_g1_i2:1116-1475(+)